MELPVATPVAAHMAIAALIAFFMPLYAIIPWPLGLVRVHARARVPLLFILALSSALLGSVLGMATGVLAGWVAAQLLLVLAGWKIHASQIFRAVHYPRPATAEMRARLPGDTRVVLVELDGLRRAYPLNYVAQHHVVNDRLGVREIAVTFCPMCHTAVTFDTTGVGPLEVATLYNGNMVFSDVGTYTWWQQATGESMSGPLHPRALPLLFAEILTWDEALASQPDLEVITFTPKELLPFTLPVPGMMERMLASQFVPGIRRAEMDTRLPAREMILGIETVDGPAAWRKAALAQRGFLFDPDSKLLVVLRKGTVAAFHFPHAVAGEQPDVHNGVIADAKGNRWDLRGRSLNGGAPLRMVRVSEEYWFGWARFHPRTRLYADGPAHVTL